MLIRALLHFLLQLAVAVGFAAIVALLWAVGHGGAFVHSLSTACFVIGSVALLFGAMGVGGMSPSRGLVETAGRAGGRLPGMPAFMWTSPGTTTVNATVIFFLTGVVMFAIGFALRG